MNLTSAPRIMFAIALFTAATQAGQIARTQNSSAAVFNNYSLITPGMPNYGIAQGSIVQIYGTGLTLASSTLQQVPLPTTLNGTTVNITVNGTTTHPFLYYVSPNQIDAIIPSATPVGTGQITVTVQGAGTGAPAPITIVQSAFGMLSLNAAGNGPAAVYDANSNILGLTNAANPGDFITLWGTGLGPVTGDESIAQQPTDLTNIPIEVDIGGQPALVQYHGRSQYPGLDQINVQVPQGVSGCHVSVVVRSGNMVSNFGTIPVAPSGRTCSEPVVGLTAGQIQSLSSQSTIDEGVLLFNGFGAEARFVRYTNAQYAAVQPGAPVSLNDCTVLNFTDVLLPPGLPIPIVPNPLQGTALSAGPAINLTTPSGSGIGNPSLPFQNGEYAVYGLQSTGSLRGTYTFSGPGADIGPFTAHITWPGGAGSFQFATPGNGMSVNRANGLTVTWNQPGNSEPGEYIEIYGFSLVPTFTFGAEFTCFVPLAAGQFRIPAQVLLALPSPAIFQGLPQAALQVDLVITNPFAAPGLDVGTIHFVSQSTEAFFYQ